MLRAVYLRRGSPNDRGRRLTLRPIDPLRCYTRIMFRSRREYSRVADGLAVFLCDSRTDVLGKTVGKIEKLVCGTRFAANAADSHTRVHSCRRDDGTRLTSRCLRSDRVAVRRLSERHAHAAGDDT